MPSGLRRRQFLLPTSYRDTVLRDGPSGYWRLRESASPFSDETGGGNSLAVTGTGITYADLALLSTSNGKHPNLTAGITIAAAGDASKFQFEGRVPMSVEFWVDPTTIDATSRYVIATYDSSLVKGWSVEISTAGLVTRRADGAATNANTFATGLPANKVSHVVVTYDGTNISIYVNGTRVMGPSSNTRSILAGAALRIGNRGNTSASLQYLGWIAELAVYPYTLTPAKVLAHYRAGGGL